MVRTFLVALRASTAIAVQICANLLSVGLSCVRALVKLPKARHRLQGRSKKKFLYLEYLEQRAVLLSPFARRKTRPS